MNIQELRKMRDAKSSNMNKIGEAFDKTWDALTKKTNP